MPIVNIHMLEGRPRDKIEKLMVKVTEAVVSSLGVTPDRVRVIVWEIPRTHWYVGGQTMRDSLKNPEQQSGELR